MTRGEWVGVVKGSLLKGEMAKVYSCLGTMLKIWVKKKGLSHDGTCPVTAQTLKVFLDEFGK
jgi:hypothetical protein